MAAIRLICKKQDVMTYRSRDINSVTRDPARVPGFSAGLTADGPADGSNGCENSSEKKSNLSAKLLVQQLRCKKDLSRKLDVHLGVCH